MRNGIFSSSVTSSPVHSNSSPSSSPSQTFSDSMMEENIDNAEAIITKWDGMNDSSITTSSTNFSSLFRDFPEEGKQLLKAIGDLQRTMHHLIKQSSNSELLIRSQNLMELAMKRLEMEFHSILSSNRNVILDSESVSSHSPRSSGSDDDGEELQNKGFEDLKAIAECMMGAGYGKECINLYKLVRKSTIDESLYKLGLIDKINLSNIQKMEWNVLELKIKNWLHGYKIAVNTIFLSERNLCDHVFSSSEKIIESCFTEICKERALVMLTFPETVAKYKKLSAEKIFRILDIYGAISTLWPVTEMIFSFESLSAVRLQAVTSLVKLSDAVRAMLSEFELAIEKDSSKTVIGGNIHPLTRYVMNYLVFMADYGDSLADIVADLPLSMNSPLPEAFFSGLSLTCANDSEEGTEESPIAVRMAWLILVLLCKLDAKAELYKEVPLSYLFLANNLDYIVQKVKSSSLALVLGSGWIFKQEGKFRQYASNYERMGWSKVLMAFPDKVIPEIPLDNVKESFKKFNLSFEEAYRTQSTWIIPNPKLRERIKISLAGKIIPIYREFYDKYRSTLRGEINDGVIIKFAPDDLQNYLSDLFYAGVSESTTSFDSSTQLSIMSMSH